MFISQTWVLTWLIIFNIDLTFKDFFMHYFYIIYNSGYHIFCSLHSSFCFGSLVPTRTQRKWKCEHGSLRADRTGFLTNWNFARHGLCTRAHAQRCDLQYSRASTRAILTAMLLNCRDRGVKGRRGGAGICMDHGRRRRCTWSNDQARCVSRTTRLLLILLVFSPFFCSLFFSSSPPSPPPPPPPQP